jgi:hypothetical protein
MTTPTQEIDGIDSPESLERELSLYLARNYLLDFTEKTYPEYKTVWYHKLICSKLDDLLCGKIKRLMIFTAPQHGKFLPASTPIYTPKGWTTQGKLVPGDLVFGQDGKQKKVIAITASYVWPVADMIFQNKQIISCAPEHLWKVNIDEKNHHPRN